MLMIVEIIAIKEEYPVINNNNNNSWITRIN
jgi:hypothetical protein